MSSSFSHLIALSKKATLLQSIHSLLEWDQETYMPEEAIEVRSQQLQLLASLIHEEKTSPEFQKALSDLIDIDTGAYKDVNAHEEEKATLREWREEFLRNTKLPASFVKEFAKVTSEALPIWDQAKKQANFSLFTPHLEKIVLLSQQKAEFLGYEEHPYDALLHLYEPGLTVKILKPLFASLKIALKEILQKRTQTLPFSLGCFPKKQQMQVGDFLLNALGFSSKMSRLDVSSHPFCVGIHPKDIRMTTRIDEHHPISNISSVMHEAGHGLYHSHLPKNWFGTPICEAASFGVDESQSRFWETIIGKSLSFWRFFYPKLQEFFPDNLQSISLKDFYESINKVEPSLIRVEADEVTYCLHIILRFELEVGLMEGSIKVKEIPLLWKEKMQESLGITPSNDSEGCLQDVHWAMGGIGYFPSYALGNLLAAELLNLIQKTYPDMNERIESGDFTFLRDWLKKHIHEKGKLYHPGDLIKQLSGKPLGIESYIQYLQNKFLTK